MRILIEPPIILDERGATDIFDSIQSAEIYMEPIDVADNRYVAFDSAGRLLRIQLAGQDVRLEAAEEVPNHAERLRELLIKFLKDCGSNDPGLATQTLPQLVEKSSAFKTQ